MSTLELAMMLQILVWVLAVGVFVCSGQASLFHPCLSYLAFHFIVFVVRPLLVHFYGFNHAFERMMIEPTDAQQIRTLQVTSLALIVFMTAGLWGGWSKVGFSGLGRPAFSAEQIRALKFTLLLLSPVLALSIMATRNGVEGERVGDVMTISGAGGYVNDAQKMLGTLIALWLIVSGFRWTGLVPAAAYVLYRCWVGWSRWTIVVFFFMLVLGYAWHQRRKWPSPWLLLPVIPFFFAFSFLGENRDYLKRVLSGAPAPIEVATQMASLPERDRLRMKYDTVDFANYDFLTFIVSVVPERTGTYTYGAQYLQLFTEPIPRQLWKGKPAGSPVQTFSLESYGDFWGYTVSLPGDGWMTGGWIGVILVVGIAGWFLGRAHRKYWANPADNFLAVLYLAAIAPMFQLYRDGGVVSISKFLLWTCLPILVWIFITWVLRGCRIPGRSVYLSRGMRVTILAPDKNDPLLRPPGRPAVLNARR